MSVRNSHYAIRARNNIRINKYSSVNHPDRIKKSKDKIAQEKALGVKKSNARRYAKRRQFFATIF
jgi:hypothetical protein